MGYLKGANCYLSGAIEQDKPGLVNWRTAVIDKLINDFGIDVFDPNADPKQSKAAELKEAKSRGDLPAIQKIASAFVRKDLGKVDRSDFVLARIAYEKVYPTEGVERRFRNPADTDIPCIPILRQVPTTGTIHEIINADLYHKPTLVVCENGAHMIPSWLIGFLPTRYLFGSWEEVFAYLKKVDNGECKDDNRWHMVYGLV